MMSHPVFRNAVAAAVMRQDGLLPLTETVQGLVGVMVDLQVRLRQNTAVIRQRLLQTQDSSSWTAGLFSLLFLPVT